MSGHSIRNGLIMRNGLCGCTGTLELKSLLFYMPKHVLAKSAYLFEMILIQHLQLLMLITTPKTYIKGSIMIYN